MIKIILYREGERDKESIENTIGFILDILLKYIKETLAVLVRKFSINFGVKVEKILKQNFTCTWYRMKIA